MGPHSKGDPFNKTTKKCPNHRPNHAKEANARNKTIKKTKTIDITMKNQAKHRRQNEQPSQNHRQNNETQAKPIAKTMKQQYKTIKTS